VEEQVTTNAQTKICAIDLNLSEQIACCTIQTAEGSILASRFIGGGNAVAGFRKKQLGRVARNRSETGLLALGEQGASIVVFEHLGNLKPEKGRYSHRGNVKRAFWMKGRIFRYARYKAYHAGGIITCRVNPKQTSRVCARCGGQVVRYAQGQPEEGYQVGAPLVVCPVCKMRGHADRNASLKIGQRLIARYQPDTQKNDQEEKPHAPRLAERSVEAEGVIGSQDARGEEQPSIAPAGHGTGNGHGTAQKGKRRRMGTPSLSILPTLRLPME
jgi:putative transposase